MKYKKNASVLTSDFWYDLTDGGYIKPEKLLEDPNDVKKIRDAIATLRAWKDEMIEKDILELA